MQWLQISVDVTRDETAAAGAILEAAGALSVTLLDAADEPLLEPLPGEQPLWTAIRMVALFPADFDHGPLQRALCTALRRTDLVCGIETLEDRDWSNTWRDDFRPMRFGAHLWVCPSGEDVSDPHAVVVRLDPGLAFGTGTHATTALCLEWLAAHPPLDRRVIDYGCGSGILGIAAARLGAASVQAVDIDPQALVATRENARRNAIAGRFEALAPEALPTGPVDLLLANILANPLIELAEALSVRVQGGGCIVLTGILEAQATAVMDAYHGCFDFTDPYLREGWVLLEGTRIHS